MKGRWARLWDWLVEPSARVSEPDERRQARLFSILILGLIVIGFALEMVYVALVPGLGPDSFLPTVLVLLLLAPVYVLSRTRFYWTAALLTLLVIVGGVLGIGASDPVALRGGFLDYLIVALLLGSVLLRRWQLAVLTAVILAGILLLPFSGEAVSLADVLIGPASFLAALGAVLLLITWHRDLLEKDRQAELVEKEERYRTLVEQLPAITYVELIDPSSPTGVRSLYLSPQFEQLLHYTVAEHQADPQLWHAIVHPDDLERVIADELKSFQTHADTAQEYRLVARDGRVLWVRDQNHIRADPAGRLLSQGILLDITERKLAEAGVRSEAARSAALLRVAGRLNAQLDLEALLVAISEETAAALHVPVANLSMYDDSRGALRMTGGVGLAGSASELDIPMPRALYEQSLAQGGPVMLIRDVQALPDLPGQAIYQKFNLRSLALASLEYDGRLIGSLNAMSVGEAREFSQDERLLLQGLAQQAALAIVNTRLYKEAHWRLERLQALRAIDVAMAGNRGLQRVLDVLLEQIAAQLGVDAAMVLLLDAGSQTLSYGASFGFRSEALQHTRLRLGEGNAGRAALARQTVAIPDLAAAPGSFTDAPAFGREGFLAYYATPLVANEQVHGVLEVFHRARLEPDAEWLGFLETLAGQAAIAIDSSTLFDDLQRSNSELAAAYEATIEGWSRALDLRDRETEGHTQRVTEMALRLAAAMGLSPAELEHMRRGALLHDIGKMGVPDRILLKPGPLTDEEWVSMRQHPRLAYEMLLPIAYLRQALDIPHSHHEKWDGSGYPRGLKGEAIPLPARIFAVVDVWDALSSDRPYRRAWPAEKVLAHIRALSGSHFDPRVVEAFLSLLARAAAD